MASNHLGLVAAAKASIDRVFKDTTVDQDTTKESLEELKDFIEELTDTLE